METIGWGGVERRRLSLINHLDKKRYVFKIICTKVVDEMEGSFSALGVEVVKVGTFKHPFQLAKHQKVLQIIKSYNPHIIHGAVFEGNTMACVGGFLGRVPIIIAEETSDPRNRSKKADLLLKLLTSVADKVIGISPGVVNYLTDKAHIAAKKVQLINNGVEVPREVCMQEIEEIRNRLFIQPGDIVIGSVGRLRNFHKLFTDIIEAVALLNVKASVKILIVGAGGDRKLIENTALKLGLSHQLIMAGLQPHTAPFYQIMDIFCIASHMEGFGLVAAEAMFHCLPVIATAVGGLKDIVVDGETGFLVPPHAPGQLAEKLEILIHNPRLGKQMGLKGYERAMKEYRAEVYVDKVDQLYQELLHEKGILSRGGRRIRGH